MKFVAAGDMLVQQRIQHNYPGFDELSPFIKDADGRFFNLETTLNHEGETSVSQLSGGTYLRVDPEVLDDLKPFGFNMMSFNNNHALDFFYDGLEVTLIPENKCNTCWNEYVSLAEAAIFEYAFRFGARLIIEVQKDSED